MTKQRRVRVVSRLRRAAAPAVAVGVLVACLSAAVTAAPAPGPLPAAVVVAQATAPSLGERLWRFYGRNETALWAASGLALGVAVYAAAMVAQTGRRRRAEQQLEKILNTLERRVAERTATLTAQMAERDRAEAALRESEARYYAMFAENAAVMLLVDPDGGAIVDANAAACRFYGLPRERLIEGTLADIAAMDAEQVAEALRAARDGAAGAAHQRHRLASGAVRDVEVYANPIRVDGRSLLFSIVHDVTERRRVERALRRSEEGLASAQRVAHLGNWVWDIETGMSWWSDEMYRIFGQRRGDVDPSSLTVLRHVHPDDRGAIESMVTECLAERAPVEAEFRIVRQDGEVRTVHGRAEVTVDAARKPIRMTGVIQDITERKQTEERLARREREFHQLVDAVPVLLAYHDAEERYRLVNRHFEDWFGISQDAIVGRTVAEVVGADAYAVLRPNIARVLAGESFVWQGPVTFERAGTRHVREAYAPRRGSDGRVVGYFQLTEDVTAFKRVEEALRRSEAELRAVFEATDDAVTLLDTEGVIKLINEPAARILGRAPDEVEGRLLYDFLPPDAARERRLEVESVLVSGDGLRVDHPWGERWFETGIHPVHEGETTLGVAIYARDITDRKQAEDRIRHLATHDDLTDLPNRNLGRDRLAGALARARRDSTMAALLFIDLDGFKPVNDTLGHDAGDTVLKEVARRLSGSVRETDTVARFGGDEFIVILTHVTDDSAAGRIAEAILERLPRPIALADQEVAVGCSIGIAVYPADGDTPEQMIDQADAAMYLVKRAGKHHYRFASSAGAGESSDGIGSSSTMAVSKFR